MAMNEVSREKFFEVVGPMNVQPRPELDHSEWASLTTREVVGRSEPGYKNSFLKPNRYWLNQAFIR